MEKHMSPALAQAEALSLLQLCDITQRSRPDTIEAAQMPLSPGSEPLKSSTVFHLAVCASRARASQRPPPNPERKPKSDGLPGMAPRVSCP